MNNLLIKRTIMVVTGTRADFGLLKSTIKEIINHPLLDLKLVVTGSHLSEIFGNTINEIEEAGFPISHKLPILEDDASVTSITAKALEGFGKIISNDRPDIVLVLGDRYEAFAATSAALLNNVPVAHIHGGELTYGAIDDALRHSMTKMSWWHFVSTDEYRKRVIHLGENPQRVFNVGATACDTLSDSHLPKEELEQFLNMKLVPPVILATFHPETISPGESRDQLKIIWNALCKVNPGTLIFTKANADAEGTVVNEELARFIQSGEIKNSKLVSSLGHKRYFSLLRLADVGFGNSSSLVIEAPMTETPSVNVGIRQRGRTRAASVIDVDFDSEKIADALRLSFTPEFKAKMKNVGHPCGTPGVALRIVDILSKVDLPKKLVKEFYE